ncbi:hypothetical protein [Thermoplasma sp. Kam2015]|uniref:hypothetical protein n=1 Tax=Thermoplasma sp. Kam2015 TaxID=2094122 RepID=UPI001293819A|nr:hypothetical protein [Thermoplasma sp. Kam2015]
MNKNEFTRGSQELLMIAAFAVSIVVMAKAIQLGRAGILGVVASAMMALSLFGLKKARA